MNIWIDLANSPQVLFFRPIIAELERRGHTVLITTRDYAQTLALANHYHLKHTPIGAHGGTRWTNILYQTGQRVQQLLRWAHAQPRIDLAVSHNAYSQALAASYLGVPFATLMDYEHQPANHLCFRLARRVIVPECFPDARLKQFGAASKVSKYSGLKEQIYLSGFRPLPYYFQTIGVETNTPIVVMRPPAPWAAYHRKFGDTLFDEVLDYIAAQDVKIIFTPRVNAQADHIRARNFKNVWIPPRVLDGPNLVFHAHAVISGGGTLNREAAILGTPAYTVFKGELGAVDEWLITRGRLTQIARANDFEKIMLQEKARQPLLPAAALVAQVTNMILETVPARVTQSSNA